MTKLIKILLTIFLLFNSLLFASDGIDEIKSELETKFLEANKNLEIESIELKTYSKIDLSEYNLASININSVTLRRDRGTFKAIFTKDDKKKQIFYRYKIIGKSLAFKAIKDLDRDTILQESDFEYEQVDFKYQQSEFVGDEFFKKAKLKRAIKKGTALSENLIEIVPDISRGDSILAILNDGLISIKFEAFALTNGSVGDIIKIKNTNNTIFNAKIISKNRVEVQ